MQNEPTAVTPDDSTTDDGSPSVGANLGNSVTLTQEQADAAGIADPKPGDQYHITLTIGDTSAGITGNILDGSAQKLDTSGPNDDTNINDKADTESGDEEDDTSDGDATPDQMAVKMVKKPKQKVISPQDMGISMTSGLQ